MSATILVVDDHPTSLKLACGVLESEGYRVLGAADAEQVRAVLAAGTRPDLILMDLALPGVDGLTLTRQLKADPATQGIPIVAVTASAMKGDEAKAFEAGCDGYLTKPIGTRELCTQVAASLRLSRL
ncbi:MAG: response regulator [Verrucomicrobia bacterium]|nr:response regulator [Verrucomicrobiota bacterium]